MEHPYTAESLEIMLRLTRIRSTAMQMALHDHFVLKRSQKEVAERYGFTKQHFGAQVIHIRKSVKPVFDAYADFACERALQRHKSEWP